MKLFTLLFLFTTLTTFAQQVQQESFFIPKKKIIFGASFDNINSISSTNSGLRYIPLSNYSIYLGASPKKDAIIYLRGNYFHKEDYSAGGVGIELNNYILKKVKNNIFLNVSIGREFGKKKNNIPLLTNESFRTYYEMLGIGYSRKINRIYVEPSIAFKISQVNKNIENSNYLFQNGMFYQFGLKVFSLF